jgi:hypothetical protein
MALHYGGFPKIYKSRFSAAEEIKACSLRLFGFLMVERRLGGFSCSDI